MGVKSTVHLTRAEAERKYVELKSKVDRRYHAEAAGLSASDLEDKLMEMNDLAHGGEGYENYSIVGDE